MGQTAANNIYPPPFVDDIEEFGTMSDHFTVLPQFRPDCVTIALIPAVPFYHNILFRLAGKVELPVGYLFFCIDVIYIVYFQLTAFFCCTGISYTGTVASLAAQ